MKLSIVAKVFAVGLIFTFGSALYSTEVNLKIPEGLEFPQVLGWSAHYPLKLIYYGVPFAWFRFVSGVILPWHVSYSFTSFEWQGFTLDILIYGAFYAAIMISGYLIEQRLMHRKFRRIGIL